MDWYKNICSRVITPLWAKWEGSDYLKSYKEQKRFQFLDRGQIESFQFQKIKSLLEHAYHNCPFYKDFYSSKDIRPEDIKTWSDFRRLPMLTKTMIRKSQGKIIAQNIPRQKLVPGKTSGSTGKPLDFFIDEDSTQKQRASALLTNEWAGYRLGEKAFTLFGQSTSTIKK